MLAGCAIALLDVEIPVTGTYALPLEMSGFLVDLRLVYKKRSRTGTPMVTTVIY
jgi:hypothetical protein